METSLSQTILAIRDSLTEENWNKGSYFNVKKNNFCMCAHGAAQRFVNPKVKSIVEKFPAEHTDIKLANQAKLGSLEPYDVIAKVVHEAEKVAQDDAMTVATAGSNDVANHNLKYAATVAMKTSSPMSGDASIVGNEAMQNVKMNDAFFKASRPRAIGIASSKANQAIEAYEAARDAIATTYAANLANEEINYLIDDGSISGIAAHGFDSFNTELHDATNNGTASAFNELNGYFKVWKSRPYWVNADSDKGNLQVHYLMGMVGLTTTFNDHKNTTLEMVKEKFTKAYEVAKMIEGNV